MATKTIIAVALQGYIVVPEGNFKQQIELLTLLNDAHEKGDYSKLVPLMTIEGVKTHQTRRRFDDDAPAPAATDTSPAAPTAAQAAANAAGTQPALQPDPKDQRRPEQDPNRPAPALPVQTDIEDAIAEQDAATASKGLVGEVVSAIQSGVAAVRGGDEPEEAEDITHISADPDAPFDAGDVIEGEPEEEIVELPPEPAPAPARRRRSA